MSQRRRSKGKVFPEDEEEVAGSVIILTSSEDEEANRDLTVEIAERAKRREAKRQRSENLGGGTVVQEGTPIFDVSSDDVELVSNCNPLAVSGGEVEVPVAEGESRRKKRKKKPKKNKKIEEDVPKEELLGTTTTGAIASEANDAADSMTVQELLDSKMAKEEEPVPAADSVVTEVDDLSDNVVLRRLLRGPRYFDPGDNNVRACYNCGEEGHTAVNCTMEKRQKPCFVCGMFGHNSNKCTLGQDCFVCKRRGHQAKDCPVKYQPNSQDSKLCLRCGNLGHDMLNCRNDYASDDMKEIQCYVCKRFGHLCCAEIIDNGAKEVSCYNCAQFGHTGLGCAKSRGETSTDASPMVCYKCGKEGHFARGCTRNSKFDKLNDEVWTPAKIFTAGESSTSSKRISKENRPSKGWKSAPHYVSKAERKNSAQYEGGGNVRSENSRSRGNKNAKYEGGGNMRSGNSRSRGGWIVDDPGDLPEANGWRTPATSASKSRNGNLFASDGYHASLQSPIKNYNHYAGTFSPYYSMGSHKHGLSASRFGSSNNRHW